MSIELRDGMSEVPYGPGQTPNTILDGSGAGGSFETLLRGYRRALYQLSSDANRPYSAPWATATHAETYNRWYVDTLRSAYARLPEITPSELLRVSLTSMQRQILGRQSRYPTDAHREPATWHLEYSDIRQSHEDRDAYRRSHLEPQRTVISGRTVTYKLAGLVFSHLLGEHPTIADLGCSDGTGLVRLIHNATYPYGPLRVVERQADGEMVGIDEKSLLLNGIIANGFTPGKTIGVDMANPRDPEVVLRTRASSTPEEHASGNWACLHDRLMAEAVDPEEFGFVLGDFSRASTVKKILRAAGGVVDLATSSWSFYIGTAESRRRKFRNAQAVGRYALWQDAVVRSPRNPNYLSVMRGMHWSMNVFFMSRDHDELHHLLSFTTGRTERDDGQPVSVRVHPSFALLARGGPYEAEAAAIVPNAYRSAFTSWA